MNTPELNRETPQAPQGFRALVKKRMEAVNLSLRTVASETGISPAYLSRLLSGERGLPPDDEMNGDTANKVGTYLKALAAQAAGVPFYIAAPHSTLDFACAHGASIPIEDRGAAEVCHIRGLTPTGGDIAEIALAPADTRAANPAFDVTPAAFIRGIITGRGIAPAGELARLYPEHER